ncbi:hypothetical protein [Sporosarcina limicola]|uniref:Uncharacterized protein n=1 Tax=Sporosarcina limicola TaxID=34101 RepID=A0A927MKX9_9BACL|nr:hypothetical protein [Sporosarcina limicola]MBE1555037.1 hypothetical protein [Sporosarcina limicola]
MTVTNYYIIGSFTVPSSWIALIVAFVVAYSAVRTRYGKKHAEILSDAFFYLVIVWKLSVILIDFSTVIRSPLTVLYFHGGILGFYFGLVFIIGKILWGVKKGRYHTDGLISLFSGAVLTQVVFQLLMVLLNEGEWVAQGMTIVVFTLFAVYFWLISGKSGNWTIQLALLFMAVHVFVASFQPKGLVGTPLITTIVNGILFAILFSLERRTENGMEE